LPNVDISINGRLYPVACDEGQEPRILELSRQVDTRVRQLVGDLPAGMVGETHVLVLAGLMLADELEESRTALAARDAAEAEPTPPQQANGAALEDAELLVAAVDHLAQRIQSIADRLERP
jgi:cell division protein ZapA